MEAHVQIDLGFQRIINFNMNERCMYEYKHVMNIKQYLRMRQNIDVKCENWFDLKSITKKWFLSHKMTYFQINQK